MYGTVQTTWGRFEMAGLTTSYYTLNGEILSESTGGVRLDYLTDALGSVTATLDQTTAATHRMRYKPYGANLVGPTLKVGWCGTHGYRGTGLRTVNDFYVRARHYAPKMGQWTTRDPLWPRERAYGYVGGRTTTTRDRLGQGSDEQSGGSGQPVWTCHDFKATISNGPCSVSWDAFGALHVLAYGKAEFTAKVTAMGGQQQAPISKDCYFIQKKDYHVEDNGNIKTTGKDSDDSSVDCGQRTGGPPTWTMKGMDAPGYHDSTWYFRNTFTPEGCGFDHFKDQFYFGQKKKYVNYKANFVTWCSCEQNPNKIKWHTHILISAPEIGPPTCSIDAKEGWISL